MAWLLHCHMHEYWICKEASPLSNSEFKLQGLGSDTVVEFKSRLY